MWQSADPILETYLDGKINGGVYGPSSLGLYSYVSQNPLKYVDPNGLWSEEVHFYDTLDWAKDAGFSPDQAERIARIDSIWRGNSFMPIIGKQGYHFNVDKSGDSRMVAHQKHFDSAVKWGRRANSWRTDQGGIIGARKNFIADVFESVSLDQLGKSLHPLQDIDAHKPEYTETTLGVKWHSSPELFNSGSNLADDKLNRPERWESTKRETEKALDRYREAVRSED